MSKQEKIVCEMRRSAISTSLVKAFLLAFTIPFLLIFSLCLVADEQRAATIAIGDVPYNAIEDAAVKNQAIHWEGNVYEPEKLKSIAVPNISYFEINSMDSIKFSVDYKFDDNNGRSTRSTTVFVRGVKYNELPFVYDYEREIDLEPVDVVFGQYGFKQYELKEFKVSKSPPWVVSVGYQKIGLSRSILVSMFVGIFALTVVWFVAIVFIMVADLKKKKK